MRSTNPIRDGAPVRWRSFPRLLEVIEHVWHRRTPAGAPAKPATRWFKGHTTT